MEWAPRSAEPWGQAAFRRQQAAEACSLANRWPTGRTTKEERKHSDNERNDNDNNNNNKLNSSFRLPANKTIWAPNGKVVEAKSYSKLRVSEKQKALRVRELQQKRQFNFVSPLVVAAPLRLLFLARAAPPFERRKWSPFGSTFGSTFHFPQSAFHSLSGPENPVLFGFV